MGKFEKCGLLGVVLLAGACTKKVNECQQDSDCTDVAYPFCDVNGEYPPSGGDHNVCTIVPPNCPVERCGCEAGAVTCSGDQLSTCASDGKSTSMTTCSLGCATSGDRCFSFKPSNGLDVAMNAAAGEPDAVFALAVTIDTDACAVVDSTNLTLAVKTLPLPQTSAPGICAVIAKSFDIGDVTATGSRALAFVAPGAIRVRGKIDLAARDHFMGSLNAGPGSVTIGACVPPDGGAESGGAGNATNGGDGLFLASVPVHRPGGLAQTNFTPLIGGCVGGPPLGGGGGGALQIVSFTSILLDAPSLIALGAVGGGDGGGGGSGGTLVLEAPTVAISGSIAANGGGGGYTDSTCPADGADATNDTVPAPGGMNTCHSGETQNGGAGGTVSTPPQNGTVNGGGGGSVGRVLIRTADGTFVGPGSLFSIVKTLDTLIKI